MKTIKGIIPPMITPLKGDDQIDREGTVRLTEHILAGGVHALFLLGTTGEAQSLSYECRYDFVELVCRQVAGRVPVLVGVTDTSLDESVKLAAHAAKCGAVAVVAAAPYYFAPSQQELIEYYTALADALPQMCIRDSSEGSLPGLETDISGQHRTIDLTADAAHGPVADLVVGADHNVARRGSHHLDQRSGDAVSYTHLRWKRSRRCWGINASPRRRPMRRLPSR